MRAKLAAYEDTGLTPEQINKHFTNCIQLNMRCHEYLELEAYRATGLTTEQCAELAKEVIRLAQESVEREKTLAKLEAEVADLAKICWCNDCKHYEYVEDEGGSTCCCSESPWWGDYPLSDCSCSYCERREGTP